MHLSLLLFLQRGPPRFNWVLMESNSPVSLQSLELDRLIPPSSAPGFIGCVRSSHSAQSGHETRWRARRVVRAGCHPLRLDNSKGAGHLGGNSHLAPLSTLWEKLSRATGRPSTRLALLGLLFPESKICILTGKYRRF